MQTFSAPAVAGTLNPEHDTLLSFAEVCARLPGHPHVSTLHRWRTRGVRGHVLRTVLVGGRRFIALSALQEFVARLSGEPLPTLPDVARRRHAELERAEAELDAAGIA